MKRRHEDRREEEAHHHGRSFLVMYHRLYMDLVRSLAVTPHSARDHGTTLCCSHFPSPARRYFVLRLGMGSSSTTSTSRTWRSTSAKLRYARSTSCLSFSCSSPRFGNSVGQSFASLGFNRGSPGVGRAQVARIPGDMLLKDLSLSASQSKLVPASLFDGKLLHQSCLGSGRMYPVQVSLNCMFDLGNHHRASTAWGF